MDPRRQFVETLIDALKGAKWPIIVYSSYEQARLRELAASFPDLKRPIAAIVRRLSDLLPVVRGGLYHPGFEFSNSIKTVAPALCPDVTYDDLEDVADGTSASTAFWLMASGRADATTIRAFASFAARVLPPRHVGHGEATSGSQHARSEVAAKVISVVVQEAAPPAAPVRQPLQ